MGLRVSKQGEALCSMNVQSYRKDSVKMDRNEKKQDPIEDVKKFFQPTGTFLTAIIAAPGMALFTYMISDKYGPSKGYAPMPDNDRIYFAVLMACLIIVVVIGIPWGMYFKSLMSIKKDFPTEEQKRELNREFLDAVNVFEGRARIAKKYTFLKEGLKIIPTKEIKSFHSEKYRGRTWATHIRVDTGSTNLPVSSLGTNKEQREKADELIKEAEDILTRMRDSEQ